jgi:hypothetical protein
MGRHARGDAEEEKIGHTLGRYRDRIGQNVEMVHKKVVLKG